MSKSELYRQVELKHNGDWRKAYFELVEENARLKKDAERWSAIEVLMVVGNVELTQNDDGGYGIYVDPVENFMAQSWSGNTPDEVIDKIVKQFAEAESKET